MGVLKVLKGVIVLGAVFAVPAASSLAQECDWKVGTGGNSGRNGFSSALGPLVNPGEEPDLYWSGGEYASFSSYPVIEGDNLILSRREAVYPASYEEATIVCYDVFSGEERWRVDDLPVDTYHNYPQLDGANDGLVFVTRAGGATEPEHIYALDIDSGDIRWKSEATVGQSPTETVSFAPNGDLIAADTGFIFRINRFDGATIWAVSRWGSSSDGSSVSVFGNRGYIWCQDTMGMYVGVIDLDDGGFLYRSDYLESWGFQQACLTVGPDGTVFAPIERSHDPGRNPLWSLTDTGSTLRANWFYNAGYQVFGHMGVGPDGSVYTMSETNHMVRLDPETGVVLNTASEIISPGYVFIRTVTAVGNDGTVYVSWEDHPDSGLVIYTAELELLWSSSAFNGLRGLALGDGALAVAAAGSDVRVYAGRTSGHCPLLFRDGFEAGDTSAWINTTL